MTQYNLYLGRNYPGGEVSWEEFWSFAQEEINPRFGDGYTISETTGVYKGETERNFVVSFIRPRAELFEREIVEKIGAAYRQRFEQESVLITELAGQETWIFAAPVQKVA